MKERHLDRGLSQIEAINARGYSGAVAVGTGPDYLFSSSITGLHVVMTNVKNEILVYRQTRRPEFNIRRAILSVRIHPFLRAQL